MRILLVYPDYRPDPAVFGNVDLWQCEPLALEYLAAGAKIDSHDVQVLDLRLHPEALEETLKTFDPDVVGVTGYSMHVPNIREICRKAKESKPGCFTIVGGHHATVMPEDFFHPEIDFIVGGEGVSSFRALLDGLGNGDSAGAIPGTWRRGPAGFEEGPERQLYDINSLPLPDRTINSQDRSGYFMDYMRPIALIRMSEGCAFNCSFCSLWKILKGKYLVRDLDGIVEELGQIEEQFVHIVDDEPWLDKKRMLDLAGRIEAAGIRKKYFAYCRVDTLVKHTDLIDAWCAIGLEAVFLGIEAVTTSELDNYNKKIALHQIEEALEIAESRNLVVHSLFIVRPTYTMKEFKRLRRFLDRHNVGSPGFTVWTPLPGTDELNSFKGLKALDSSGRPDWYHWDLQHPVVETTLPEDVFMKELWSLRKLSARGGH